jgi:hypothetical protein
MDESLGAKERRTKTIAHELSQSGGNGFALKDLDEAIKATKGIGVSDYTREQYLPRVLNELDYTWHPTNREIFVDPEAFNIPEVRDPSKKPLMLMDNEDRRLAIKLAAYRKAKNDHRERTFFSTTDAIDVFRGRVRKSTVRPLMTEVADSSPGYYFDQDKAALKLSWKEIKRNAEQNRDVIDIDQST